MPSAVPQYRWSPLTHTHHKPPPPTHTKLGRIVLGPPGYPGSKKASITNYAVPAYTRTTREKRKRWPKSTLAFLVDSSSRGTSIYISRIVDGSLGGSILREHLGQSEMEGKINAAWVLILTFSLLHVFIPTTPSYRP